MSDFCKIYYAGSCKAPYNWITSTQASTNRLIYINGGEGGYIKDGVKVPFKKDCLYLITGVAHYVPTYTSYKSDQTRLDHSWANFEIVPPILSKEVFCFDSFEDEEILVALNTFKTLFVKSELSNGYVNLNETSKKLFKSIVVYLVEKFAEKFNYKIVTDKVILNALKLMNENLEQKQPVSKIAELCHLSTNSFIRRFKKEVGETPYSYLKKLKVRTAQNMRTTSASLEEIAEKCGYSDSSALLHAIGKQKQF